MKVEHNRMGFKKIAILINSKKKKKRIQKNKDESIAILSIVKLNKTHIEL